MPKYRKKPVVIEAIQLDEDFIVEIREFVLTGNFPLGEKPKLEYTSSGMLILDIPTLEGLMRAFPGDWIIRGIKGELYPCKDDIFQAIYEKVADNE